MSSDDIIIRPKIHASTGQSATSVRAHAERKQARMGRPKGLIARLARAKMEAGGARRLLAMTARSAGGGFMGGLGMGRAARALMNPVGLAVTAGVLAVVAATRLVSGRSFENMGQQVKKVLLGDGSAEALAGRDARQHLTSNDQVALTAHQIGLTADMSKVFNDMKAVAKQDYQGRELFEQDPRFQVDNTLDMLILRFRDGIVKAWDAIGGDSKVRQVGRKLEQQHRKGGR